MFLNSVFSGLKTNLGQSGSFLSLATTLTFAVTGSLTSYYLFKGSDNKEAIEKLSSELDRSRQNFLSEKEKIKLESSAEIKELSSQELALKGANDCILNKMREHDESTGYLSSSPTPNLRECEGNLTKK